jgi:hypothetical protein
VSRDGGFLGRWSRLKRSEEAKAEPEAAENDPGQTAPEDAAPDPRPNQEAPDIEIAPEDLPKVEDITAESDISAFLQKGVPKALKAAALRRAWSLDPAIRDYIGPSEYAWDFNNPSSIPGFGGGTTAGEIGRALRSLTDIAKEPESEPPPAAVSPAEESIAARSPTPDDNGETDEIAAPGPSSPAGAEDQMAASARPKLRDEVEPDARGAGRRHGGAIPK